MQAPRRRLTPSQRRQLERLKKRRQRLVLGILGALCLFSFCMGRCSAGWVTLDVVSPSAAPGTVSQSSPKNSGQTDPLLTLVNDRNPVPSTWTVDPVKLKRRQSIDRRAYTALQQMMDDARAQGLKPVISSSYRTNARQQELYTKEVGKYRNQGLSESEAKEKASGWVAIPGTSEHELGLAVDIVSEDNQNLDISQEETDEQQWLMKNCWKYGFILRYPTNKSDITHINYEPWHYRYVGVTAAKQIMQNNLCLEEYLNQV